MEKLKATTRTCQMHFWVSEEELCEIRTMARLFGLTITQYVRYVLHVETERHRTAIHGKSVEEIATLGTLIRKRVAERDEARNERAQRATPHDIARSRG